MQNTGPHYHSAIHIWTQSGRTTVDSQGFHAHYWLKCIWFANQLRFLISRQSYPPPTWSYTIQPHQANAGIASRFLSLGTVSVLFQAFVWLSNLLKLQMIRFAFRTVCWHSRLTVYSDRVYPFSLPFRYSLPLWFGLESSFLPDMLPRPALMLPSTHGALRWSVQPSKWRSLDATTALLSIVYHDLWLIGVIIMLLFRNYLLFSQNEW